MSSIPTPAIVRSPSHARRQGGVMIPVASNQLWTPNSNRITASRSSYSQRQGVRYFRQNVLQRAKEPH